MGLRKLNLPVSVQLTMPGLKNKLRSLCVISENKHECVRACKNIPYNFLFVNLSPYSYCASIATKKQMLYRCGINFS